METTVVLNNFPKNNILLTVFFISVKNYFIQFCLLPCYHVTIFNLVLLNLTFLCFNLHSSMCSNKQKYQELFGSILQKTLSGIHYVI